jgi:hypothetical protein
VVGGRPELATRLRMPTSPPASRRTLQLPQHERIETARIRQNSHAVDSARSRVAGPDG